MARLGQYNLARLFVYGIIAVSLLFIFSVTLLVDLPDQLWNDLIYFDVEITTVIGRAGDNERGPCLVNKNGIHFVDYSIEKFALNPLILRKCHVVPQVIKPKLIVSAVSYIRRIGFFALRRVQP